MWCEERGAGRGALVMCVVRVHKHGICHPDDVCVCVRLLATTSGVTHTLFLWPVLFIFLRRSCVCVCCRGVRVGVCWCVLVCVLFGVIVSVGESGRVLFGESVC